MTKRKTIGYLLIVVAIAVCCLGMVLAIPTTDNSAYAAQDYTYTFGKSKTWDKTVESSYSAGDKVTIVKNCKTVSMITVGITTNNVSHSVDLSSGSTTYTFVNNGGTVVLKDDGDAEITDNPSGCFIIYRENISYSGDLENLPSDSTAYISGYKINISSKVPTKPGYKFLGWATSADGDVVYQPGAEVTFGSANIELYAKWQALYTVSSGVITAYNGSETVVEIPSKIDGVSITMIGAGAFQSNTNITRVTIPNTVTSIGESAFNFCEKLGTVTFESGSGIEKLNNGIFASSGLNSITIPDTVTSIETSAFANCAKLETVTFGTSSNLTTIKECAFMYSGLTAITIPDTVTSIGDGAFMNCTALTSFTLTYHDDLSLGLVVFEFCAPNSIDVTFNGTKAQLLTADANHSIYKEDGTTTDPIKSVGVPITLKYDGNGATAGTVPATIFKAQGSSEKVTIAGYPTDLKKNNATVCKWNTEADYSGTYYEVGDEITLTEDLTLYAVWKLPTSGALVGGYIMTEDTTLGDNLTIATDTTVSIDLCGNVLNLGNFGIIDEGDTLTPKGTLTVTSSDTTTEHLFTKTGDGTAWTLGGTEVVQGGIVYGTSGTAYAIGADKLTINNVNFIGCTSGAMVTAKTELSVTGVSVQGCACGVSGSVFVLKASGTATISDVTVSDSVGVIMTSVSDDTSTKVTITDATITGNQCIGTIMLYGGELIVKDTSISDNTIPDGTVTVIGANGTISLDNVTISNNEKVGSILTIGGSGDLTLNDVTVKDNIGDSDFGMNVYTTGNVILGGTNVITDSQGLIIAAQDATTGAGVLVFGDGTNGADTPEYGMNVLVTVDPSAGNLIAKNANEDYVEFLHVTDKDKYFCFDEGTVTYEDRVLSQPKNTDMTFSLYTDDLTDVTYQWYADSYLNGKITIEDANKVSGETSASLSRSASLYKEYLCIVSFKLNGNNYTVKSNVITYDLVITEQPTLSNGFTVTANTDLASYQWYCNNKCNNICSGQTTKTLGLSNKDAIIGVYFCRVMYVSDQNYVQDSAPVYGIPTYKYKGATESLGVVLLAEDDKVFGIGDDEKEGGLTEITKPTVNRSTGAWYYSTDTAVGEDDTYTYVENGYFYLQWTHTHGDDEYSTKCLTATSGEIEGGTYFLAENLTLTGNVSLNEFSKSNTVIICLNGYVLNFNGYKISATGGMVLVIDDCGEETHYYNKDSSSGLWTETASETENAVVGGIMTGGTTDNGNAELFLLSDTNSKLEIKKGNFVGNKVCCINNDADAGTVTIINAGFYGNTGRILNSKGTTTFGDDDENTTNEIIIQNNTYSYDGTPNCLLLVDGKTLTIYNCDISYNTVADVGGVYGSIIGFSANEGVIKFEGGSISKNDALGVYFSQITSVEDYDHYFIGGSITENTKGGILIDFSTYSPSSDVYFGKTIVVKDNTLNGATANVICTKHRVISLSEDYPLESGAYIGLSPDSALENEEYVYIGYRDDYNIEWEDYVRSDNPLYFLSACTSSSDIWFYLMNVVEAQPSIDNDVTFKLYDEDYPWYSDTYSGYNTDYDCTVTYQWYKAKKDGDKYVVDEPIDTERGAQLQDIEDAQAYICRATLSDDTILDSNVFIGHKHTVGDVTTYHDKIFGAETSTGQTYYYYETDGYYYLPADWTPDKRIQIDCNMTLCLCGHVLDVSNNYFSVLTGKTLTIVDCKDTAHYYTVSDYRWVPSATETEQVVTGGVIYGNNYDVELSGGSLVMEAGAIVGGRGIEVSNFSTDYSVFTMNGGYVCGCLGQTKTGIIHGDGTFVMNGGVVSDNFVSGANLITMPTVTLAGGKICDNIIDVDGYSGEYGVLKISSDDGCTDTISVGGTIVVSGNKMIKNSKFVNRNLYIDVENSASLSGVTLEDGADIYVSIDASSSDVQIAVATTAMAKYFTADDIGYYVYDKYTEMYGVRMAKRTFTQPTHANVGTITVNKTDYDGYAGYNEKSAKIVWYRDVVFTVENVDRSGWAVIDFTGTAMENSNVTQFNSAWGNGTFTCVVTFYRGDEVIGMKVSDAIHYCKDTTLEDTKNNDIYYNSGIIFDTVLTAEYINSDSGKTAGYILSGYYYLTGNITMTTELYVPRDQNVYIALNGKVWDFSSVPSEDYSAEINGDSVHIYDYCTTRTYFTVNEDTHKWVLGDQTTATDYYVEGGVIYNAKVIKVGNSPDGIITDTFNNINFVALGEMSLHSGLLTLNDCTIRGCATSYLLNVYSLTNVTDSILTLNDVTITDNYVKEILNIYGTLLYTEGSISNNNVENTVVRIGGMVEMTGGEITDNVVRIGAVYYNNDSGILCLGGDAVIYDNLDANGNQCNVWYNKAGQVSLAKIDPTADMWVGIYYDKTFEDKVCLIEYAKNFENNFVCDNKNYVIHSNTEDYHLYLTERIVENPTLANECEFKVDTFMAGSGTVSYQWYYWNENTESYVAYAGQTDSKLAYKTLDEVFEKNYCVATFKSDKEEFTIDSGVIYLHNCEGTDKWHDKVFVATTELTSGYYYLQSNVILNSDLTIPADNTVYICLNGHILDMDEKKIVNNGTLYIYDCEDTEHYFDKASEWSHSGSISDTTETVVGGVLYYGALENNGTMNLTHLSVVNGQGEIMVKNIATLALQTVKFYGGNVTTTVLYNSDKLSVNDCSFTSITAGTEDTAGIGSVIENSGTECTVVNTTFTSIVAQKAIIDTMKDITITSVTMTDSTVSQASILLQAKGTLNGLEISGVTATTYSAGIYVLSTDTVTVSSSIIMNNKALLGAGILVEKGAVVLKNVEISNNILTIDEEHVYGGSYFGAGIAVKDGTLTLQEKCVIYDNKLSTGAQNNVVLASGKYITFGTGEDALTEDSKIGVDSLAYKGYPVVISDSSWDTASEKGYLLNDNATCTFDQKEDEGQYRIRITVIPHTCGKITHDYLMIAEGGTLPEGNYFMREDVTLNADITIAAGTTVRICMNGKVLNLNGHIITNNGTLYIDDCSNHSDSANAHYFETASKPWTLLTARTSDSVAVGGGIIYGGNREDFVTAAISTTEESVLTVKNIAFVGNYSKIGSGVVEIEKNAQGSFEYVNFYGNKTAGCEIYTGTSKKLVIKNCDFIENECGMCVLNLSKSTDIEVSSVNILRNTAGGISCNGTTGTINNVTIQDNISNAYSMLNICNTDGMTVDTVTIQGNTVADTYLMSFSANDGKTTTIENLTAKENEAGILFESTYPGTVIFEDCSITNNTAIFTEYSAYITNNVVLKNTEITENTVVAKMEWGSYDSNSLTLQGNVTIYDNKTADGVQMNLYNDDAFRTVTVDTTAENKFTGGKIGISVHKTFEKDTELALATTTSDNLLEYFVTDMDSMVIVSKEDAEEYTLTGICFQISEEPSKTNDFEVSVNTDDNLFAITYQWYYESDTQPEEGFTSAQLATVTKAGNYYVKVKRGNFVVTSATVSTSTVTFDANAEGTEQGNAPADVYNMAGRPVELPENKWTYANHIFVGWFTKSALGEEETVLTSYDVVGSANETLYAIWKMKEKVTVVETAQTFTYDGTEKEFSVSTVDELLDITKGVTVKYYQGTNPVTGKPKDAGKYKVVIERTEDDVYASCSIELDDALEIKKKVVSAPEKAIAGSKAYTGTTIISDITATTVYKLVENNGGIDVGSTYPVIITLKDANNYEWQTYEDGQAPYEAKNGNNLTYYFAITQGQASITVDTTDIVVTYGKTVSLPQATSNLGDVLCDKTGSDLKNVGTYTVTYKVEGTANYAGDQKTVTVVINKAVIKAPTDSMAGKKVYIGETQVSDFVPTSDKYEVVKNEGGKDVGKYDVVVRLKDAKNYMWSEGEGDITLQFEIYQATVDVPDKTDGGSAVYNGKTQVSAMQDGELYKVYQNAGGIDVGKYDVVLTLKDSKNYKWATTDEKTYTVDFEITCATSVLTVDTTKITKKYGETVVLPTATATFGEVVCNYTAADFVNVGMYEVVFTVEDTDNFLGDEKRMMVVIEKTSSTVTVDTTPITVVYGEELVLPTATATFGEVVCNKTVSDLKNAGTYTVTYKVVSNSNFTGDEKSVTVTVTKATVDVPEQTCGGSAVYNGKIQVSELTGNQYYVVSENEGGIDVGTYEVELSLIDSNNYIWEDGSLETVKVQFTIEKGQAVIDVDTKTITVNYGDTLELPTASSNFGAVICDTKVSDMTEANEDGYVVTYTVAETDNYAGDEKTLTVVVKKLTYDMSGVSLQDVIVLYDGYEHEVLVEGRLPAGVTVSYENNVARAIGVYHVVASFTGDSNYNDIPDMTATLSIRMAEIVSEKKTTDSTGTMERDYVKVSAENGIDANITVKADVITITDEQNQQSILNDYKNITDVDMKLKVSEKVGVVFDIQLIQEEDGKKISLSEVNGGETMTVKIFVPKDLDVDSVTRILQVNKDGTVSQTAFSADMIDEEGYIELEVTKVGKIAFVQDNSDSCFKHWILLGLMLIMLGLVITAIAVKNRKVKSAFAIAGFVYGILAIIGGAFLLSCEICIAFYASLCVIWGVSIVLYNVRGKKTTKPEEKYVGEWL